MRMGEHLFWPNLVLEVVLDLVMGHMADNKNSGASEKDPNLLPEYQLLVIAGKILAYTL
jgi:hypothetical protein